MRRLLPCWLLLLFAWPVAARDYINIDEPGFRPYPLAVPDCKDLTGQNSGPQAALCTEVLRNDLEIAGMFKILDPRSYIADPRKEGLSGASINFADWSNVGAAGLVKVGIAKVGEDVKLEGHLFDVASGQDLVPKKPMTLSGPEKKLRHMVHALADAIVEYYTGTRGIFFTQIVFAKRTGNEAKSICLMDFDGANERCVVQNGAINLLPSWSYDGSGIYYSSYLHGGPHLYLLELASGKITSISRETGLNTGAAPSPDGKLVAATLSRDENSEIYLMNPDGSGKRRLTRDWGADTTPSWSPDGKRIAFVSDRAGSPQIYVMNADGGGVRRLTFQGNYNTTPSWSPRGDWILFTARDERRVFDIFKVNPDKGEIVRLTQDQGDNEQPCFSPDGSHVVFSSTRSGESKLYLMNADGTNQRLISRGKGEYSTPRFSPWFDNPR